MAAQIVSGIAIGAAVAVVGAFVSHLLIRSREREHWEREDAVQRQQWEREDQLRYLQERLEAYRRLYYAVRPANLGFIQDERFHIIEVDEEALARGAEEVSKSHAEIQFVRASEAVLSASSNVNSDVQILRARVHNHLRHKRPIDNRLANEWLDPPLNSAAEFRVAARKELRIEDGPPEFEASPEPLGGPTTSAGAGPDGEEAPPSFASERAQEGAVPRSRWKRWFGS
jgi:hypothetical protein